MHIRYNTPDHNGSTRADRNEAFASAHLTPEFEIPEAGEYLWEWFFEFLEAGRHIDDGVPVSPAWLEYLSWAEITGRIVRTAEYAILRDMHQTWRTAMAVELAENRARKEAEDAANKPPAPTKRKR